MQITDNIQRLEDILEDAVNLAKLNISGRIADYIPQLLNVNKELTSACIQLVDGPAILKGDINAVFSLQSVSKLVLLIGMLEEYGFEKVFSWINAEPSGQSFAAIGHLDRYGPVPSNPLINAGAIALSSRIPGSVVRQLEWVDNWTTRLFGKKLRFCEDIYTSELASADRNRSLAYLMRSTGVMHGEVEEVLKPYFALCSYECDIKTAAYLPELLANGGKNPQGQQIISQDTANQVVSIMGTCGLYNESGMHLVRTGLPAKSGVSGLVIAVAPGRAGIAVYSPKLNNKGTSFRGAIILNEISSQLNWHFAAPRDK